MFMEIRPVSVALTHGHRRTDGRTDMTKLISAFSDYANASKNKIAFLQNTVRNVRYMEGKEKASRLQDCRQQANGAGQEPIVIQIVHKYHIYEHRRV